MQGKRRRTMETVGIVLTSYLGIGVTHCGVILFYNRVNPCKSGSDFASSMICIGACASIVAWPVVDFFGVCQLLGFVG